MSCPRYSGGAGQGQSALLGHSDRDAACSLFSVKREGALSADGLAYDAANWGASVVAVPMGIDINYMRLTRKGSGDTAFKIIGAIDA